MRTLIIFSLHPMNPKTRSKSDSFTQTQESNESYLIYRWRRNLKAPNAPPVSLNWQSISKNWEKNGVTWMTEGPQQQVAQAF